MNLTHLFKRTGLAKISEIYQAQKRATELASECAALRCQLHRAEDENRHQRVTIENMGHKVTEANAGAREAIRSATDAERRATAAELKEDKMRQEHEAMGRELQDQVTLNAELVAQMMPMQVDTQRHSALVDSERVQVLTQLTVRNLDLPKGLFDALLSPFAFNVARHLIRKLTERGNLTEGKELVAKEPLRLANYREALAIQDAERGRGKVF